MIGRRLLWLIKLVLMLAIVTTLSACSVSHKKDNPPAEATQGTIDVQDREATEGDGRVELEASWAWGYGSIKELAQAADLVVKGRVTGIARTYKQGNMPFPFTDFNVEVDSTFKGSAASTVQVVQTGGASTGRPIFEIRDDPLLVQGTTYFLFMRRVSEGVNSGAYAILGGPDGRFEVLGNRVYSLSARYPDRKIRDLGVAGSPLGDFILQVAAGLK